MKNIAVIGSGISGIASAWLLAKEFDITIFEQNDYIGGHTNTRPATFEDKTFWVDTGLMVFNHKTYHNLVPLFEHFNIPTIKTDMSFGVTSNNGEFEFSTDKTFLQKKNVLNPSYLKTLFEIVKYNKNISEVVDSYKEEVSLQQVLQEMKLSKSFQNKFLLPVAGAIWSTPKERILDFPAKQFITFCENHGLLTPKSLNPKKIKEGRVQWYTVEGGAKIYVEKMIADMNVKILLNSKVEKVTRNDSGVEILANNVKHKFDGVVFASHPDQTIKILEDASDEESKLLNAFEYQYNKTYMHKNVEHTLKTTKDFPSWTYVEEQKDGENKKVELTYYMNRLQHIDKKYPVFITLNPIKEIPKEDIFYEANYAHPQLSVASRKAQKEFSSIQGFKNTWHTGAWLGHGFHEDGLKSALDVVNSLGIFAPWQKNL